MSPFLGGVPQQPRSPEWWRSIGPAATDEYFERFTEFMSDDALREWIKQPLDFAYGSSLAGLLCEGHTDKIDEALYRLELKLPDFRTGSPVKRGLN